MWENCFHGRKELNRKQLIITFAIGLAQLLHIVQNQHTPHMSHDQLHYLVGILQKDKQ